MIQLSILMLAGCCEYTKKSLICHISESTALLVRSLSLWDHSVLSTCHFWHCADRIGSKCGIQKRSVQGRFGNIVQWWNSPVSVLVKPKCSHCSLNPHRSPLPTMLKKLWEMVGLDRPFSRFPVFPHLQTLLLELKYRFSHEETQWILESYGFVARSPALGWSSLL